MGGFRGAGSKHGKEDMQASDEQGVGIFLLTREGELAVDEASDGKITVWTP